MTMRKEKRSKRFGRRAAAAVEMAVVAPLLLTMVFGIIEFGWVFWVKETLTNATREGCRVAVLPGSTDAEIRARFDQAVAPTGLNITNAMVALTHSTAANPVETVTVTVPRSQVSLLGNISLLPGITNGNITASCSMRKEGS
jgi:Flp pilus assembly protein TadG